MQGCCQFRRWPAAKPTRKCVSHAVIGSSLAHNDLRFILVQAILPYVQLGSCLSPGAQESWGDTSLRAELCLCCLGLLS